MGDIRLDRSEHVIFVLQKEESTTLRLDQEPEGWDEDGLEIVRNSNYHGVFTQFTGGLKFRGKAKDFIMSAYSEGGLNANLYLIRYDFRKSGGYTESLQIGGDTIRAKQTYRGIADFETYKIINNVLEINFNSDELERLIKSHEKDEFEIQREKSIDDIALETWQQNQVIIKGRNLESYGEHENMFDKKDEEQPFNINFNKFTIPSRFITKGFSRHVEVTNGLFDQDSSLGWQANFFYNDAIDPGLTTDLLIEIDADLKVWVLENLYVPNIFLDLVFYKFTGSGYEETSRFGLNQWTHNTFETYQDSIQITGLRHDQALTLEFEVTNFDGEAGMFRYSVDINQWNVKLTEKSNYEAEIETHRFAFVNEVASRLMEIMSSKRYKFYSKFFGRNINRLPASTGVPTQYQDYDYEETGEAGEVGLIHGFDLRRFTETNELYRSMTISMQKLIDSLQSTFNIGVAVENSKYGQRLRFEKLEHFYRPEIAVKLPFQPSQVTRQVSKDLFFSGLEFGSSRGGDYEEGLGLDEPNVKTKYVTPLRKTSGKYSKLSEIRSDEYGMEIVRRKPEFLDPTEDMTQDDHIWFLDLKLTPEYLYEQLNWQDVLQFEPTGVFHPESYRAWRFTPKRCLLRHGWVFRAGMEQQVNMSKKVQVASTESNINLVTQYIGEANSVSERSDLLVGDIERAIILPEIVKFKHPVDNALYDLITGTTSVVINGEAEEVPNYYFKFQWTNENEELETGYLKSFKPRSDEFEFFKANDQLVFY